MCGILAWALAAQSTGAGASKSRADLPDPLVGTWSMYELSHGNTYPAVFTPFGMAAWTAQTGEGGWPYQYAKDSIRNFRMTHRPSAWTNVAIAMCGLWIPAAINLVGVRQMAWFQNVTVVLKFLPLLFVGIVGWFFVDSAHFGAFNASGGSLYSGIGIAAGVALFSFIGVEAAAVTAKRVKNPRTNVGRASLIGTALSAMLYVLVTAAVMGLVPHDTLVDTGSPFVNAFQSIFPSSAWAGKFIALIAVISGIGALNGWTLIVTETSRAMANDDLFPRPFGWTDRHDTAWFGILVGTALPSLLMLWRYTSSSGLTVFTYLVDLTVVTVAIPYFFSALAQLTYLVSRRRRVQGWQLARDLFVAGVGILFSMWVTFASGYQVVYQALVVILAGMIIYAFLNARRQRLGEVPEPVDNVPGEPVLDLSTSV